MLTRIGGLVLAGAAVLGCALVGGGSADPLRATGTPTDGAASAGPATPPATLPIAGPTQAVTDAGQVAGAWWVWDEAAGEALELLLQPDLRYSLAPARSGAQPLAGGDYTFGEGVLTWQQGWFDCAADRLGSYELWLAEEGDRLVFSLVGDECAGRQDWLTQRPAWQRGEAPP